MVADVSKPFNVLEVVPGGGSARVHTLEPGRYELSLVDDPIAGGTPQWLVLVEKPQVGAVAKWWEKRAEVTLER